MRLFSQTESQLFESLFHEKLQQIRAVHFAEVDRIQWLNIQHKLNLLISEHLKFKKEFIDARVEAYVETCRQLATYPNLLDYQEFAAELTSLVRGGIEDVVRAYKNPLGPIHAQSLERTMELLQIELGQIIGPAMAPVQRLVSEGSLNRESANREEQMQEPGRHVLAFYGHIGKSCQTLGDLNWSETRSYLDRIPPALERVDFLHELSKLPDDGVVNNTLVDPAVHTRITNNLLRPLREECSRLLAQHFNLENVLKEAEELSDNAEAIDYLWRQLRSFKKYHPGTLNGQFSSSEWRFCHRIEEEIQYRKDLQAANANAAHYSMSVGENRGNIQVGGTENIQMIGRQDNEIK